MENSEQSTVSLPPPEVVTLPDGLHLLIRPIQPDDAYDLQSTFKRLSARSVYLRFMSYKNALTDEEAERLARVDYHTHMAFVGICEENGGPIVVGVARYALLDPSQPDLAESAVVVSDDYQSRGIGKVLLWRLVRYARLQGIRYLRGFLLLENQRMVDMIQKAGMPYQKRFIDGSWEITIDIGA